MLKPFYPTQVADQGPWTGYQQGSVFVEFADFKYIEPFLQADPKPSWNGEELLIMTKYELSAWESFVTDGPSHRKDYCEMKMKEKGIKSKGDSVKDQIGGRRGFNAFREMAKGKNDKGKSTSSVELPKPEIWLEFMGSKIRVHEEEGGSVKEEDVPHVKGATMKFEGCGGEVQFNEIKVGQEAVVHHCLQSLTESQSPLRERFSRAPFIQYNRGDDHGLVGFDNVLSDEDIAFVKETLKTLNSKDLTWSIPDGWSSRPTNSNLPLTIIFYYRCIRERVSDRTSTGSCPESVKFLTKWARAIARRSRRTGWERWQSRWTRWTRRRAWWKWRQGQWSKRQG